MTDVMVRAPFLLSKLVMPHVRAADDGVGATALSVVTNGSRPA